MNRTRALNSPQNSENIQRDLILIEPVAELEAEFRAMAEEFQKEGDERFEASLKDFSAYLKESKNLVRGVDLKTDRVPETEFWLVNPHGGSSGSRILGRGSLRHRLTPALKKEGGHIGYGIRPSARREGYGTLILKLLLEKAGESGLKKILITCDTDNTGSAKIIEKNGGVLAGRAISEMSGKQISRYWIEL